MLEFRSEEPNKINIFLKHFVTKEIGLNMLITCYIFRVRPVPLRFQYFFAKLSLCTVIETP